MKSPEPFSGLKLRTRIFLVFAVMFVISLLLAARARTQVRQLADRMDESFLMNRRLLEVENALEQIAADVEDYLNTRSTVSLEAYYDHAQAYQQSLSTFATTPSFKERDILEKNIVNLSQSYLSIADRAIAEKRGRDIDAYQVTYATLLEQHRYLQAMLATLSNRQFEENAVSNDALLASSYDASRSAALILGLVAIVGIFLIYTLRRMVDPVESEMREREIRMETQVKDAELKYLRAQINPHFLFNTLNAGTQLAMMEDAGRTYQYLHKVADFYRYLVHEEGLSAALQQEIDIVDDFIYIINVRYGGEIHYEKEVEEEALSMRGPSMILQPIVENCVKHGLSEKEGEKRIRLTVRRKEDMLCIEVTDNGSGMDKAQIAHLLQTDDEEAQAGEGVGLRNVLRRLRMYYNKEDVMEIESTGEGTVVRLLLPVEDEA